ncbi:MAG TPA: hypothetical protein VMQ17_21200 [Candidatus Sulfotelmatobacter sp.]|nr:hypothetical protein [Candidatus Sulfotelmatobacter sp.]
MLIHSHRKLDPDVPSPAQFNHVITAVPRGDKFLWLDTTPEVAPYGLLLLNLRDKQALMIPTSKPPALVTTPQNPPFPEEHEFSAEGKLGPDGTFTGHIEQSYRGDTEVLLRSVFRQVSQSQWKEAVQRFSYGLNFGGDVGNVKMTPPEELDKPFQLSYDYVRKNFGDWENRPYRPAVATDRDGDRERFQGEEALGAAAAGRVGQSDVPVASGIAGRLCRDRAGKVPSFGAVRGVYR